MNRLNLPGLMLLMLTVTLPGCMPNPYSATNRQYKKQARVLSKSFRQLPGKFKSDSVKLPAVKVATTNFNMRKPNFVIIHHTAQNSCDETLQTFTRPRTQVSAHYVICKDGTIHHMLNDYLRAWHGGIGKWGNLTDVNSSSIGIELDNNGFEPFPAFQLTSLLVLLDTLKARYTIPPNNFIGHSDIAPKRKVDPNIYFPWKVLAEKGFGLWYADTTGVIVPETFSSLHALRMIGYDTRDSVAAISAFKRHFVQDTIPMLDESDRKILYSLYWKY